MGYYTKFKISVEPSEMTDEVLAFLADASGYSAESIAGGGSSIKWYNYEDHVLEASTRFPVAVITIDGDGEDAGDVWRMYATGGAVERVQAVITYPEMTLKRPELQIRTVIVPLAGVNVCVQILALPCETDAVLLHRAKATLRDMLDSDS